jgi:hypothetical protein
MNDIHYPTHRVMDLYVPSISFILCEFDNKYKNPYVVKSNDPQGKLINKIELTQEQCLFICQVYDMQQQMFLFKQNLLTTL